MSEETKDPVSIAIVDDHVVVGSSLRLLIEAQPGMRVVGEANDRSSCLALVEGGRPDIVLLDLCLGKDNGATFVREILDASPKTRVIVLTGTQDMDQIRLAVQQGAAGVVRKDVAADVLIKAILKVHGGEAWLDRTLTARVLASMVNERDGRSTDSGIASLSRREIEIISVLAEGQSNRGIARRLHISEITVRHHLTSIFSKLGVSDRLGLVVYAYQRGLIPIGSTSRPDGDGQRSGDPISER